jgi:ATP-dependent helicase Lhr and Lhr-like helicase
MSLTANQGLKIHPNLKNWLMKKQWKPFGFQRDVWRGLSQGKSGLLHATTGSGKTYAVWLGFLNRVLLQRSKKAAEKAHQRLIVIWLTPMRALAADTLQALQEPTTSLLPDWQVAIRTGDTSSAERTRQQRKSPQVLVTTPESLCLMLGQADCELRLGAVELVVVDEWHELMGNKRGVQVQLALARLIKFNPELMVWGLSATLGNLTEAMQVLHGHQGGQLVEGATPKKLTVDTLVPPAFERMPWAGHLGMSMRDAVVTELDSVSTALVFCNTRSQAELWYQALLEARPEWAGLIALHHGSLDKEVREWVEAGLKEGRLKVVVCTSSLDLGVDFSPVERVLQVGSAKGVARLLQRAGRSGHSPGKPSRVTLVPTNALELVESAAAQDAVAARQIESRASPNKPLDVLVQHLVTIALGSGFRALDIFAEVKTAFAYKNLTQAEFDWALDFVTRGGQSLTVYEEYRRVVVDEHGVMRVPDKTIAKRHRMSIGTIVSDASIQVKWLTGGRIGVVEESFVGRLKKGDHFLFAGRMLELVRIHEMTAYVRKASGKKSAVPRWNGGKMPLSSELADAVLARLERAEQGEFRGAEMQRIKPLLVLQNTLSGLPSPRVLLAETLQTRDGHHLFLYPFAGRNVHIGLGALLSWRAAQAKPATFSIAVNDYGLELLSPEPIEWQNLPSLLSTDNLLEHVMLSLNSSELALRKFREIARISGLVFQGFPGAPRSNKQLQASAGLFYEVFKKHDSGNLLLIQAQTEVLEQELDIGRLKYSLERIALRQLAMVDIQKPTPFAFPLMVERLREKLSTEKLSDRIARMIAEVEASIRV